MSRQLTSVEKMDLEGLVDSAGLPEVIASLGELCLLKGQHVREAWQDQGLADAWDELGVKLGRLAVLGGKKGL